MSKGDSVQVEYSTGNGAGSTVSIEATTNGSSVVWSKDREWVTVEELTKAGKPARTLKVKTDSVIGILEVPLRRVPVVTKKTK